MPSRLLDEATHDRVYVEAVRPALFADLSASRSPQFLVVGGQPGAGKSQAAQQAGLDLARYGAGYVNIAGDELRVYHPSYAALLAEDRSTAAEKTNLDVGLWVERAIRDASAERFNTVFESTLRNPASVGRTVEQFTQQGFAFELRVVVTNPELSMVGIYERFAKALETPGAQPRFTLPQFHTDALANMPKSVATVAPLAKAVRFFDREGRELYSSRTSEVSPVKALEDLRRVPLPKVEAERIAGQWASLAKRLDVDGVPDIVRQGVQAERARFTQALTTGRALGLGRSRGGIGL